METVLNRLDTFIQHKKLSYRAFEKSIDASNSAISKAISRNSSIGSDVLEKVFATYPDLNATWLFTGKGEMIITPGNEKHKKTLEQSQGEESYKDKYLKLLEEKTAKIDLLEKNQAIHFAQISAGRKFFLSLAAEVRHTDYDTQSVILGKLEGAEHRLNADTSTDLNESEGKKDSRKNKVKA